MKPVTVIVCFLGFLFPLLASEKFTVDEVGVSILCPNGWKHDAEDTFGFLIRPSTQEDKHRIRIHMTGHRGISLEEAIQRSVKKVNELREEKKHALECLLGSSPVTTKSKIKGLKAIIGQDGVDARPYLNRYYFQKPNDSIFCVCVYFYGDVGFAAECEKGIIDSLTLTK